MKKILSLTTIGVVILLQLVFGQKNIPHLEKVGDKCRLMVHGEPFLMLGGELGNSTASTMESMELVWQRMNDLNVNTILVPVYWELLEPEEGKFDFELIDNLILEARKHDLKLVPLWFGSWKNSMSSHVPAWVKLDQKRFPRARCKEGIAQEILTPFSENNMQADLKAYLKLLEHIKKIDAKHQTVILMQPENEIGMLPSARDYCDLANEKFKEDVPKELIDYLVKNKKNLNPEFYEIWEKSGCKTEGNWEEVFGKGLHTDEIFMAWYFARYADKISAAGKKVYPLPTYVNAALNRPGKKPGEYPSAGPLPHILDVWMAASPNIDFYSPDFYTPRFKHWNDLYVRQENPLFIPEHGFNDAAAAHALYAIGHYGALGFSPFSIQQTPGKAFTPKEEKLAKIYELVGQIKPLLDENVGKKRVEAVLLDKDDSETTFVLGDYELTAVHTHTFGWEASAKDEKWGQAAAIIVQTGDNEFYYAGFGVAVTFKKINDDHRRVGILKTDRGYFKDGEWTVYQHLNGDQTHQGRHIRAFIDDVSLQRFTLYDYK